MKRFALPLVLALVSSGCEPADDLIENFDVDSWCGDQPCGWEVDGTIDRVGTWHARDYAVSLASDDAMLYQVNEDAGDDLECIAFSLMAKVQPGTKVFVELDFFNDGFVDWKKPVPAGDFQSYEFYVTPPRVFEGIRFIVRKEGPGEVVLAKLRALDDWDGEQKCTAAPVRLQGVSPLTPCDEDDECTFGTCEEGLCNACGADRDCDDEQVCESVLVAEGSLEITRSACIGDDGARELGRLCESDDECSTGICCEGTCSECCDDAPCRGADCVPAVSQTVHSTTALPMQCDPGLFDRPRGAACMDDDDCESEHCLSSLCDGPCSFDLVEECASSRCEVRTIRAGRCD